ncbi:MAG TPA: L,D-transpeptidase family protein [Rhizomicrobium sp.]|nr:L,D-transpeptidase family protein [Rhizomicrobium sp.]
MRALAWAALVWLSGMLAGHAFAAAPVEGIRIWYPADAYPRLALPDGRQQEVRSMLNISKAMRFGDFVWDEKRIPQGQVWIRIDLGRQLLSVFRAGHEIGTAIVLYGSDGKATPTGKFPILEKDKDHTSHSYDAPMPYMLRLTRDGVAIHGSDVRKGWATHGCIGVPLAFAKLLFATASKGDVVDILPAATKRPQ